MEQTYEHDLLGRVIRHDYLTFKKTLRYEWDAVGNRTAIVYPDGNVMRYTFDTANQLVSGVDSQAGTFTLGYDDTGQRTFLGYPNGLTARYQYDTRDRVLSILTEGEPSSATPVQVPDFRYGYDSSGNRTFMDRSDEGKTTYQYDPKDQLVRADFPSGDFQAFTYDPVGNRLLLVEREAGKLKTTRSSYDPADELLEQVRDFRLKDEPPQLMVGPGAPSSATFWITTYSYDGNGARVRKAPDEDEATAYAWDARERMLGVTEGKTELQSNRYDLYNRRTLLTEGQQTTVFLYDGVWVSNRTLCNFPRKTGANLEQRHLWLRGQLVGEIMGHLLFINHTDAIGSVVASTNQAGATLNRTTYLPFGESRTRSDPSLTEQQGFIGARGVQFDPITNLTNMWHRFYEPSSGLFLSDDPMGRWPFLKASRSLSSYCGQNPLRWTDSSGLQDEEPEVDPEEEPGESEDGPNEGEEELLEAEATEEEVLLKEQLLCEPFVKLGKAAEDAAKAAARFAARAVAKAACVAACIRFTQSPIACAVACTTAVQLVQQ